MNSSVFDIDDTDNVLKWFNDLAEPLVLNVYESQMYKSYITTLVARQLAENQSSVTTSLIDENDNSIHTKKLKETILK